MASGTLRRGSTAFSHRGWHLFDGQDAIVGRMAGQISRLLVGKHKPNYTPHHDCGDTVVVVNADKIRFTGKKWTQKLYRHHTGHPGGLKTVQAFNMHAKHPLFILRKAVSGMMEKNQFRHERLTRLRLFKAGDENIHSRQFFNRDDPAFDPQAIVKDLQRKELQSRGIIAQSEVEINDDNVPLPSNPLMRERWLKQLETKRKIIAGGRDRLLPD